MEFVDIAANVTLRGHQAIAVEDPSIYSATDPSVALGRSNAHVALRMADDNEPTGWQWLGGIDGGIKSGDSHSPSEGRGVRSEDDRRVSIAPCRNHVSSRTYGNTLALRISFWCNKARVMPKMGLARASEWHPRNAMPTRCAARLLRLPPSACRGLAGRREWEQPHETEPLTHDPGHR